MPPLFTVSDLHQPVDSLTPHQKDALEERFREIKIEEEYCSWIKWMRGNFAGNHGDAPELYPTLRQKYVPSLFLYVLSYLEAMERQKLFIFADSSLYNPYLIRAADEKGLREVDSRLRYEDNSAGGVLVDVSSEVTTTQAASKVMDFLHWQLTLDAAVGIKDYFDYSLFPRISPEAQAPDREKFQRLSREWYDMDQGIKEVMVALNLIHPKIKTESPSCQGHTAKPELASPYFHLSLSLDTPLTAVLLHNLHTVSENFISYHFFAYGDFSIDCRCPGTRRYLDCNQDNPRAESDAERYANFWSGVAQVANEFFTEAVVNRIVSKEDILSEPSHYERHSGVD